MADPARDRRQWSGPDYAWLIQPDRVHGSLYTDPRVFADELARIWYRTWVYVGRESEVRQPGDYVRKSVGRAGDLPAAPGRRRNQAGRPAGAAGEPRPAAAHAGLLLDPSSDRWRDA